MPSHLEPEKSRAAWKVDQDSFLLAELVAWKEDGIDSDGSSFKSTAWKRVEMRFNEFFEVAYTPQQLKSRYVIVSTLSFTLWQRCFQKAYNLTKIL